VAEDIVIVASGPAAAHSSPTKRVIKSITNDPVFHQMWLNHTLSSAGGPPPGFRCPPLRPVDPSFGGCGGALDAGARDTRSRGPFFWVTFPDSYGTGFL